MDTGVLLAILGLVVAPFFGFAGVWYANRANTIQKRMEYQNTSANLRLETQTTAATTAATVTEAMLNRLDTSNRDLSDRNERNEQRIAELVSDVGQLTRRLGGLEADNARLSVENESLRREIDRLVDEVQRERGEKFELSRMLSEEQTRVIEGRRERERMQSEINTLKDEVRELKAAMANGNGAHP